MPKTNPYTSTHNNVIDITERLNKSQQVLKGDPQFRRDFSALSAIYSRDPSLVLNYVAFKLKSIEPPKQ